MPIRSDKLLLSAALASGLLAALPVAAQAVYRIVAPDGRVTFSDRPPPAAGGAQARPTTGGAATDVGQPVASTLPYELGQIAQRFPVTLYTGKDCAPCAAARNLLVQRGVPFAERTVETNEDIEALQRISTDTSLPFGTIGSQQLKGYSDLEWMQFLDAAGYPKASQLQGNYRPAPAAPLVARRAPAPVAAAAPATPAAPAPAAGPRPGPVPSNPAGIRF